MILQHQVQIHWRQNLPIFFFFLGLLSSLPFFDVFYMVTNSRLLIILDKSIAIIVIFKSCFLLALEKSLVTGTAVV